MKKLLAVALCSGALVGAPAVFAQASGNSSHGGGGSTESSTDNPPLTPSQTQTSQGAVANPPPLDRSGNPEHVSEKRPNTGETGSGTSGTGASTGAGGQGSAGNGSGTGTGSGAAGGGSAAGSSGAGGAAGGSGG